MATISRRYCKVCQRSVPATQSSISHVFHLLMTLITVGLWIPVWLILALSRTWNCNACGARTYRSWWTAPNLALAAVAFLILLVVLIVASL